MQQLLRRDAVTLSLITHDYTVDPSFPIHTNNTNSCSDGNAGTVAGSEQSGASRVRLEYRVLNQTAARYPGRRRGTV